MPRPLPAGQISLAPCLSAFSTACRDDDAEEESAQKDRLIQVGRGFVWLPAWRCLALALATAAGMPVPVMLPVPVSF